MDFYTQPTIGWMKHIKVFLVVLDLVHIDWVATIKKSREVASIWADEAEHIGLLSVCSWVDVEKKHNRGLSQLILTEAFSVSEPNVYDRFA